MSRTGPFLALLCALIVSPTLLQAQLTEEDRTRLLRGVESAEQGLDASRWPNLGVAKADILEKVAAIHRYFERQADAANSDAWLRYLNMDPLTEAIKNEGSISVLARESMDLHERLLGMTPGLELTPLRNLRSSTEQLRSALIFNKPEESKRIISVKLKDIAERVKAIQANPTPDEFTGLSALLEIIAASEQAPQLVQEFRDTFDCPNLAILIGNPLVQKAIRRDVTRTRPVNDCILGTRITGTATLNGVVTASLIPSVGEARVQLFFNGHVVSNNRGYNKPVRLRTVGNGDVMITRGMSVNADGIDFAPANTTVALNTTIQSIQHPLALVRNIAWKTARRQKPQADRIAAERMRVQVAREFETQTSLVSPMTLTDLLNRAAPTLKRLSLSEPTQIWSSTAQAIAIDSLFRGDDQLSAVVPRPEIKEPFDAAVQIHESVIENAFTTVLSGRTLDEKRLNELLEQVGLSPNASNAEESVSRAAGEDKTAALGQEEEPPFEISFSRLRPVIFEARDQTVRLGLRGTRFAQGRRVLNNVIEITATYLPAVLADGSVVLQRQGNVSVNFPGKKPLSFGQTARRPVIVKTFSRLFPQTVLDRALKVPNDAKIESLRGTEYRPRLVDADDGWLTIAIR